MQPENPVPILALKRTRVPDVESRTVYGVFAYTQLPGLDRPTMLTIGETQANPRVLGEQFMYNMIHGGARDWALPGFEIPEALRELQTLKNGEYHRYDPLSEREQLEFRSAAVHANHRIGSREPIDLVVSYLRNELSERESDALQASFLNEAHDLGERMRRHEKERAKRRLETILIQKRA